MTTGHRVVARLPDCSDAVRDHSDAARGARGPQRVDGGHQRHPGIQGCRESLLCSLTVVQLFSSTLSQGFEGEDLGIPSPAWEVGSYSSGPPAGVTPQIPVFKTLQQSGGEALWEVGNVSCLKV